MYCTKCGVQMHDNAAVCPDCGTTVVVDKSPKTFGLLSMIFGLVALGTQVTGIAAILSLPSAIFAIVCGFISKSRPGSHNTSANAGILCGFAQIAIAIVSTIVSALCALGMFALYIFFIFVLLSTSTGAGMYM